LIADLNVDKTDITPEAAENFLKIISLAGTIIWNGSMGIIGGKSEDLRRKREQRKLLRLF